MSDYLEGFDVGSTDKVKVVTDNVKKSSSTIGYNTGVGESEMGLPDSFSKTDVTEVINTQTSEKGKIKKYTTIKEFTRDYIPNPLHDFQSYNTVFTLAALTKEEVNFPNILFNKMPKFPVAHSSGKGDIKEVTFYKDIGVNLEYFVDEVDINAIVSPTQKNKHTQFTTMNFMIKEPFSIGLFLQTLNIQAAKAADDGEVNYTKAP